MNNESFIIEGNIYKFANIKPKKGGNGTVRSIVSKTTEREYVVKFFKASKFLPTSPNDTSEYLYELNKFNERYERFKKEVTFLNDNNFEGIVPIVDFNLPDNVLRDDEAYYIMPKGKQLDIGKCQILTSMKDILVLAKNLKIIHDCGFAHRDIKPENIIYLNDVPCFCDFGLVWECNDKRITVLNERLGPYKIMPPELESVDPNNNDIDFKKSDLYLLAKVLWMMIKNNNDGFRGEYDRNDLKKYVNLFEEGIVSSFEYFHELMEKATINSFNQRLNDEEFIALLEKQISILENTYIGDIKYLNFITKTKKLYLSNNDSSRIFGDISQIAKYINEILKITRFRVTNGSISLDLEIVKCIIIDSEMIINVRFKEMIKKIHFKPISLQLFKSLDFIINIESDSILREKYVLFLDQGDDLDVYIDGTYKICSINNMV